jgi:hypothetical protein
VCTASRAILPSFFILTSAEVSSRMSSENSFVFSCYFLICAMPADVIFFLVRTGSDEDITEVPPSSFTSFLVPHLSYSSLFLKPSVCSFLRTKCQDGRRLKEQSCNYNFAYFGSHV